MPVAVAAEGPRRFRAPSRSTRVAHGPPGGIRCPLPVLLDTGEGYMGLFPKRATYPHTPGRSHTFFVIFFA